MRDTCLTGNSLRGGLVIACQQIDVDAFSLQGADSTNGSRLNTVGDANDSQNFLPVGKPDNRLCFLLPLCGGFLQGRDDAFALHQAAVAYVVSPVSTYTFHTLPCHTLESLNKAFCIIHSQFFI